jgi:signal transduction histidine kinase
MGSPPERGLLDLFDTSEPLTTAEVFENLLTNAVQHNDADLPEITVDIEQDERTTTVSVADNGPGIPDDERSASSGRV